MNRPPFDHSPLMPETVETLVARLDERLDAQNRLFIGRFDSQDRTLAEIRNHAAQTNGRVTKLEADRIAEAAVKAERERVKGETDKVAQKRRTRREWVVGTIIGLLSVAISLGGTVALGHTSSSHSTTHTTVHSTTPQH